MLAGSALLYLGQLHDVGHRLAGAERSIQHLQTDLIASIMPLVQREVWRHVSHAALKGQCNQAPCALLEGHALLATSSC